MKFEFICDDGVFYTPLNKFLEFIMGRVSYQARADFASYFHKKIPIRTFENIGVNGRLYIRVDDLINQTMESYEMCEYERFNEFIDFCKKYIFSIKIIEKTKKPKAEFLENRLKELETEIQQIKKALEYLGIECKNGACIIKEQPKKKFLGLF